MDVTIVDYGMGNIGSLENMVEKVGGKARVAKSPAELASAEKIILPGVGSFDNGMRRLNELGFSEALRLKVAAEKKPLLAICLGMHLLTKGSEEGTLPGLGFVDARTLKFKLADETLRIPHMGWNEVSVKKESPLLAGMDPEPSFYFVHSYYVECADASDVLTTTSYGVDFTSSFQHGNIFATQFHPEKSHKFGKRLMKNFVELA
ncbi:MAG: imidazole glycerol phosphate synthase subunit HisH [Methanobacteriota archaeon]